MVEADDMMTDVTEGTNKDEGMEEAEIEDPDVNEVAPMEEESKENGKIEAEAEADEAEAETEDAEAETEKAKAEEAEAEAEVETKPKEAEAEEAEAEAKAEEAKAEVDHEMKDEEDDKIEEQTDSKDTVNEAEEKVNEEKEDAEAQVSKGEKRLRKCSTKGQAKVGVKEPTSPTFHIDRPVRERKSVERLVASIEKEPAREFLIPKGRGTALKDIPNVANKLSRKKNDETFKMLHVILFGRRAKAIHVKSNISQFSGFVWHENEEKERLKLKEKLDKCVKEKLLEFCDIFDIPVLKIAAKKEDIVTKLLDFLAAPQPRSNVSVAEEEKSGTSKKRSKIAKRSMPESGETAGRSSSKKQKKTDGSPKAVRSDSESDDEFEKEDDEGREKSVSDGSEDDVAEHSENEGDSIKESDEEARNQNQSSKISSAKITSPVKDKPKKVTSTKKEIPVTSPKKSVTKKHSNNEIEKEEEDDESAKSIPDGSEDEAAEHSDSKGKESDSGEESEEETTKHNPSSKGSSAVKSKPKKVASAKKETPVELPKITPTAKRSKVDNSSEKGAGVFSRKNKKQETSSKKSSAPSKSTSKENDSKEQSGNKSVRANNETLKEAGAPTEEELRKAICEILTEVDLNKATFIDILKLLGQHFKMDLEPRKSVIKVMVKEELIKLNDEDDEVDESDTEKEETPKPAKPARRETKSPAATSGNSIDPNDRCRRSDGKKWRCSKNVVTGQKYCEHHMNRGRKR